MRLLNPLRIVRLRQGLCVGWGNIACAPVKPDGLPHLLRGPSRREIVPGTGDNAP
jgi:hypothetical protein